MANVDAHKDGVRLAQERLGDVLRELNRSDKERCNPCIAIKLQRVETQIRYLMMEYREYLDG